MWSHSMFGDSAQQFLWFQGHLGGSQAESTSLHSYPHQWRRRWALREEPEDVPHHRRLPFAGRWVTQASPFFAASPAVVRRSSMPAVQSVYAQRQPVAALRAWGQAGAARARRRGRCFRPVYAMSVRLPVRLAELAAATVGTQTRPRKASQHRHHAREDTEASRPPGAQRGHGGDRQGGECSGCRQTQAE
jgi:hypothetical protein